MASAQPLPALVEHLAILVRRLLLAIGTNQIGGILGGRVPGPLVVPITVRITALRDRFARLAARIVAGTYVPRRAASRRGPLAPKIRPPSPFQRRGWLDAMLPPEVAREFRSHLHALLQEPEMAALLRVAPAPMARILGPLCWMLQVAPPEILATARRSAATPPSPPAQYQPPPPPSPPQPPPSNTLGLHPILFAPPGGPPKPA
jgi:hypothetical protein